MAIRTDEQHPWAVIEILRHCYRFINEEWPHATRQNLPDRGFEQSLRASLVRDLYGQGWEVAQEREMGLGHGFSTASGVLHEVDIVANHSSTTAIMELKNRKNPPSKNDVIVFFAKLLDYFALNPGLLHREVCPAFLSTLQFDQSGLEACLGLGVHPIAPGLRPVPSLLHNAKLFQGEIDRHPPPSSTLKEEFDDFCADLNRLSLNLHHSWFSNRFVHYSADALLIRSVSIDGARDAAHGVRALNATCTKLIAEFKRINRERNQL